jgi:hypothetical protein
MLLSVLHGVWQAAGRHGETSSIMGNTNRRLTALAGAADKLKGRQWIASNRPQ